MTYSLIQLYKTACIMYAFKVPFELPKVQYVQAQDTEMFSLQANIHPLCITPCWFRTRSTGFLVRTNNATPSQFSHLHCPGAGITERGGGGKGEEGGGSLSPLRVEQKGRRRKRMKHLKLILTCGSVGSCVHR